MNLLNDIERLVTCESPSTDLAAVARSAEVTAEVGSALLGSPPERIVLDGRTHLRWRLGTGPRKVLLLGHHDTVWPIGTLDRIPFGVRDGVLRGPGCFDMKTGVVMIFHAIASLGSPDGVTVLITGDEEIGSPSSRGLIETEAVEHAAVLVCEASADGGALKTERKGTSMYEVTLHGRAAHAGLEPERGVNATVEAAHQVLAVTRLADPATGTTVVPTVVSAGTTTNTVPARARFMVDVRVRTTAEQLRVDEDFQALRPVLDGAKVEVAGGPNRPPLELSASGALFDLASGLLPGLTQASVGGASDGNFTAGVGVPTLDGLGAVGGGAHAESEHVLVSEIGPRTELLAALVRELT
ncbi:M20 family metallopeptidase [Lentzea sp. DG1S-22]|uniref:M20 family metallopeptidase n=1 Tax=Lentzea sp. DG1S-22 TaxID=3108822 RepID=UPI002E79FF6A|nr:M20 family metallopeptidase [Lentzea sp. DG1S-22]WVH83116.1 M20 family metallopeptidase [Lentzea sp. DG1S-22]